MFEERYRQMFDKVHPKETLLRDTLAAAVQPVAHMRAMLAAACALVLLAAAAIRFTLPPKDVVTSSGENTPGSTFLPIQTSERYGCCDVRDMVLNIVSGSIRHGMLMMEIELAGEGLHPDTVFTIRLQDGSRSLTAFHILRTEVKRNGQGEKAVSQLISCKMDTASIPMEGKRLTVAVNNYDCGLNHDRYPHWEEEAAWEDVLPDCITVDFLLSSEGMIRLINE